MESDSTKPKLAPKVIGRCLVDIEVFNFVNRSSAALLKSSIFLENSKLGIESGLDLFLATTDTLLNCDVVSVEIRIFARICVIDQVNSCCASVVFQFIEVQNDQPLPTDTYTRDIEDSSLPHNEALYFVPAIVRGNITVSPTTIQTDSTTTQTDTTTPCTGVTPVVGIIEAVPAWCIIVTVVLAALCPFLLMIILIIYCRLRWAYNALRNEGSKKTAKELTKIARPPVWGKPTVVGKDENPLPVENISESSKRSLAPQINPEPIEIEPAGKPQKVIPEPSSSDKADKVVPTSGDEDVQSSEKEDDPSSGDDSSDTSSVVAPVNDILPPSLNFDPPPSKYLPPLVRSPTALSSLPHVENLPPRGTSFLVTAPSVTSSLPHESTGIPPSPTHELPPVGDPTGIEMLRPSGREEKTHPSGKVADQPNPLPAWEEPRT